MNYFLENIKNIEMTHHYYPTARGYFLFEIQQVDCLFPGDPSNIASSLNSVVSEPFNKVNTYLFSFAETTFNDKNIEGKTLALMGGYLYGNNQKILTHANLSTVKKPYSCNRYVEVRTG